MLHLIGLEFKKGRAAGYTWGSLIAWAAIVGMISLIYFVDGNNLADPAFKDQGELLQVIEIMVRATFIIYASALLSKLIISEYKDKTMALLFTYPISRKKLIFAKLIIVFLWCFLNIVIANLLIDALFLAIDSYMGYLPDRLTRHDLFIHEGNVLMQALGAAGMSLLPLVIGLRRKSVAATVASSIFIVMIVCSNNMGFTLSSIIAIPLSLAGLGILITYLSFRNVDQMDVG
ncbi:hypothetical protein PSTEL_05900 [Paenibacillus stellifer]|uniref:ABC transporter permease n=1 Tax=Paenibacillus stellifer TaxID=169760 RepID=A0A089LP92_9BACL|nr:ABC transporter permease [Paenibacillus stellifer]AIQ62702.1 hypothetical protein PSTEL_05900 [Paenibacillus stellifer]